MKKILLSIIILLVFIPASAAGNVTIKGVDFEIPDKYDGGTLKDTSYVYESGFKFRILSLDDYKNLKFNFGSDITDSKSYCQTSIAGHDAVVINGEYNSKPHTTVYIACASKYFLICFNDTEVNDDIVNLISKTPEQNISSGEFYATLDGALNDYQKQLDEENQDYDYYQANQNRPQKHYFIFF